MKRDISRLAGTALVVAVFLLVPSVSAVNVPIVQYSYPASWDGVAAVVTDLSPAGNNGSLAGTPTLSALIPPGADPATQSLATFSGGHRTDATRLLMNTVLEANGGFQYELSFLWDGENAGFAIQKIVDYAGTEFLQLENINFDNGTADLRFGFNDEAGLGPIMAVEADVWYHVVATFDTQGNPVVDGAIDGVASMVVNGGAPISQALTKSSFGDSLNRRIAFGTFPASANGIVNLSGLLHDPTVSLLPEPTSFALLAVSGLLVLRRR